MTNNEALKLTKEFLKTQDSRIFEYLWSSTVNMVQPYKYFDPSGARDEEDFLQATRIGLWEALNSFEENKGSTILSWIRMRMTQLLIKELRRCNKGNESPGKLGYKISLDTSIYEDSYDDSTPSIEALIYKQLIASDSYQAATLEWSEELYWTIIADVKQRIKYNRRLVKVFKLKLAFPDISRNTISRMLNVSRPALSGYFETIRSCISLSTEQHAL